MLISLLFSDQISGGKSLRGRAGCLREAPLPPPPPVEGSQQWKMCSTVESMQYSGRCAVQWKVSNTVEGVQHSGGFQYSKAIVSTVKGVLYSGELI